MKLATRIAAIRHYPEYEAFLSAHASWSEVETDVIAQLFRTVGELIDRAVRIHGEEYYVGRRVTPDQAALIRLEIRYARDAAVRKHLPEWHGFHEQLKAPVP